MSTDLAAVESIIAEIAACEIMPRYRRLAAGDVEMKHADEPVTTADRAAEAALSQRLTSALPGSVVVGEEGVAENPALLSAFAGQADVWVIDPIDGTRNYIRGRPEFGVMVALVRRNQTIAAWIHDPNSGDTLACEQGGGVWLRGRRLRLAALDPAIRPLAIVGPRLKEKLSRPDWAHAAKLLPPLDAMSAAAFDYARLFSGDVSFADSTAPRAAFLLFRQSKPWDHIPGLLMLKEAGGYAADLLGRPYHPQSGVNGLLVAPDELAWSRIFRVLEPLVKRPPP